jgi:hypothetical protein
VALVWYGLVERAKANKISEAKAKQRQSSASLGLETHGLTRTITVNDRRIENITHHRQLDLPAAMTKKWVKTHKFYMLEKFKVFEGYGPYSMLSKEERKKFGWNTKAPLPQQKKYRDDINSAPEQPD